MIYILDAYNVIHKIPRLSQALDKDLRTARDTLIALSGALASARGDISKIILVFDGNSEFHDLPQSSPPKIKLVFSETGEDADDRIRGILEQLAKERNKCVVSDDNSVRNHARAYLTRIMSVAEFEGLLSPKHKKKTGAKPQDSFSLPLKIANEITEAYKKELGLK